MTVKVAPSCVLVLQMGQFPMRSNCRADVSPPVSHQFNIIVRHFYEHEKKRLSQIIKLKNDVLSNPHLHRGSNSNLCEHQPYLSDKPLEIQWFYKQANQRYINGTANIRDNDCTFRGTAFPPVKTKLRIIALWLSN